MSGTETKPALDLFVMRAKLSTLRQGLEVQIAQSPFLAVVSEQRVQQTLRLMAKPSDARLTPEIAEEVCQRTKWSSTTAEWAAMKMPRRPIYRP